MTDTTADGADPVTSLATPTPATGCPNGFVKFLGTSNPFYAISAVLFLVGLRLSFGSHASEIDTWALTGGLVGYTLMLASAAVVLVRLANVWDDLRTVLLLVVLMFVATSASFDEVLTMNQSQGVQLALGGYAMVILITELILRGIRLRFPWLFRLPYYLILGVFFLYPALLSPLVKYPDAEILHWGLFAFSSVVSVAFLTLLPAVRRGSEYTRDNGSPWRWPFYPWSLFVFLAVALPLRAYLMSGSLHVVVGPNQHNILFAPWFLVPFVFAVGLILLELGLVAKNAVTQAVALLFPFGGIGLAFIPRLHDELAAGFLTTFLESVRFSPAFLTILGSILFFALALLRNVPGSSLALTLSLFLTSVVPTQARTIHDISIPTIAILTLATTAFLTIGIWKWNVNWCFGGLVSLIVLLSMGVLPETWEPKFRTAVIIHVAILGAMLLGGLFRDDPTGEVLRDVGTTFLFLVGFTGLLASQLKGSSNLGVLYGLSVGAILVVYSLWLRVATPAVLGTLLLLFGVGLFVATGYRSLRAKIPGLDYLCGSLTFFGVAMLVSLFKGGVIPERWILFVKSFVTSSSPPKSETSSP
jgi:hypothetical protein